MEYMGDRKFSEVCVSKIVIIRKVFTKLLQKNGAVFLRLTWYRHPVHP